LILKWELKEFKCNIYINLHETAFPGEVDFSAALEVEVERQVALLAKGRCRNFGGRTRGAHRAGHRGRCAALRSTTQFLSTSWPNFSLLV
jgi:hypothetical protein